MRNFNSKFKRASSLLFTLGLIAFSGGAGCTVTKVVRGLAVVNGYCVGNHGILLTGSQVDVCCQCSAAGVSPSASSSSSGDGSSSGGGGAIGISTKALANALRCTPITVPNDKQDPNVPCPTGLNDIVTENNNSTAATLGGIQSLGVNLASLISGGSTVQAWGNAGIATGSRTTIASAGGVAGSNFLGGAAASAGGETPSSSLGGAPGRGSRAVGIEGTSGSTALSRLGSGKSGMSGGGSRASNDSSSGSGAGGSPTAGTSAATADAKTGDSNIAGAMSAGGGGGGGFGGGGGGRPSGDVDGGKVDWGTGGGAPSAALDSGTGAASAGETMNGAKFQIEDPSDYFSRLQASEDLFKKIEEKYREKSTSLSAIP